MSQPQSSRLANKVAIVTGNHQPTTPQAIHANNIQLGGGSGFGAAIAIRYAQEGAKVIIGDINVEGGEKVASSNPSSITFQKMDVTSSEDWKAVLDHAVSKHGKVDILVNNAGTTYKNKVFSFFSIAS